MLSEKKNKNKEELKVILLNNQDFGLFSIINFQNNDIIYTINKYKQFFVENLVSSFKFINSTNFIDSL